MIEAFPQGRGREEKMLNRIKKNLIIMAITGTLCLTLPSFAYDSTISFININDRAYYDVEIVIAENNTVLVPFKQLANLFNIKYEANRVDKKISFITADGKQGMITQQGVFVEDTPVSKQAPIFIMQGIIDGVFNEAYVPASVIEKIMDVKLSADFETLSLVANVQRDIPILKNKGYDTEDKGPRAYPDTVSPKKQGKITLNTIGLHSYMMNDNMHTRAAYYSIDSNNFNGSTIASLNGNLLGGKYRVEATENHYSGNAFMFGGLSATYRNSFIDPYYKDCTRPDFQKPRYYYELGKFYGSIDGEYNIGQNTFGAQIWNWDIEKVNPQQISGQVDPKSTVRLTVNNLEPVILSTYAGYYSLREVQLPNPVLRVKLEEIKDDGSVVLISDERYSKFDKDTPLEGEQRATGYVGVWGYQNRFFREGANIYRGSNKKVAVGGEYIHGLRDNVTLKSKVTGDLLYEKNGTSLVYTVPTNDTLLVSGTQKSVNYLEGATNLNSIEWKSDKNQHIKARADAGVSVVRDIRERDTHAGYMGKLSGHYEHDFSEFQYKIFKPGVVTGKSEIFHTSPDWYLASTDSTSKNDRTGGKASLGFSFNSTSASGTYSRYFSNMNHRYEGGTITFDEATINAATKIPYLVDARFNSYYKHGKNHLGRNENYNYDANLYRNFGNYLQAQGGIRENYYDTKYDNPNAINRNYNTKHRDIYQKIDIPLGNKFGRFSVGHNFIRYKSAGYKNGYNMFRFGYTFPTWKRLTPSIGWGFRYYGQGGNDIYANLSYRARSGQTMSVGYQYSKNGGYFLDNMFMPNTRRHSVNFTFNDAFQVFNHGFKSVGDEDLHRGLFEAIAFIDVNNDGKYTKRVDIPMSNVPIKTSWTSDSAVTNKRGKVSSQCIEEGVYTVSINMDNLPITVAPQTNDLVSRKIKIGGGQTTRLEIPLVSTVGSVSGVLKISDDFDRNLRLTDFVVVLLDKDGKEVNYSTVGASGDFYISGLAPGRYTLQLDEKYINAYGLEEGAKSRINILIPYDYYNPTDLTEQNLEYKALSL